MKILGIETSCDETSVSIVENGKKILSNVVYSQIKDHSKFYGVVPEIASRKHLEKINIVLDSAFEEAGLSYKDITAVAVSNRPGLIGSLLIGLSTAKAFAYAMDIPIIGINHIEAHTYAPHLENDIPFPNISLVISGGHTLLYLCKSYFEYELYGTTVDDAVGEAFDKVSAFYKLGYPGGPIIDKMAKNGDENAFSFPKIHFKDKDKQFSFSYSGLKTAVLRYSDNFLNDGYQSSIENICSSFQKSAIDILYEKTTSLSKFLNIKDVIVCGGVACNSYLRKIFLNSDEIIAYFSSPKLSTDNAGMVAGLGYHYYKEGLTDDLSLDCYSRIIKKGKDALKSHIN